MHRAPAGGTLFAILGLSEIKVFFRMIQKLNMDINIDTLIKELSENQWRINNLWVKTAKNIRLV